MESLAILTPDLYLAMFGGFALTVLARTLYRSAARASRVRVTLRRNDETIL